MGIIFHLSFRNKISTNMYPTFLIKIHHGVVTNTPKLLAIPSAFIPFKIQEKLLKELLQRVLAEAIEDDELDFLEGKWLKIEVTDLKLVWYLSYKNNELIIKEKSEHSDVSFSGDLNELILIAGKKEDPDTLFFQRRLLIQGDTELGLEVKNLLDNIDFTSFPDVVNKSMGYFATFVQQGISHSKTITNTETTVKG